MTWPFASAEAAILHRAGRAADERRVAEGVLGNDAMTALGEAMAERRGVKR